MKKDAILSEDKQYRYLLTRTWDENKGKCLFIMLNPSTADHEKDDNTIRKCISFTENFGYGALHVVNLFSLRATNPEELYKAKDPVGIETDKYLLEQAKIADLIIAAWSNEGSLKNRSTFIKNNLEKNGHKLHYLMLNKSGEPRHPLYIKGDTKPTKWI